MWRSGNPKLIKFVDRAVLPRINETEVHFVKSLEWWDGPLNGTIEWQDQTYWFEFCGDCEHCTAQYVGGGNTCTDNADGNAHDDAGRHYFYLVFPLTPDQRVKFENRSGNGFYEGPDLSNTDPIGWFMDGKNQDFYGITVEKAS
jgi:hypothetical protein